MISAARTLEYTDIKANSMLSIAIVSPLAQVLLDRMRSHFPYRNLISVSVFGSVEEILYTSAKIDTLLLEVYNPEHLQASIKQLQQEYPLLNTIAFSMSAPLQPLTVAQTTILHLPDIRTLCGTMAEHVSQQLQSNPAFLKLVAHSQEEQSAQMFFKKPNPRYAVPQNTQSTHNANLKLTEQVTPRKDINMANIQSTLETALNTIDGIIAVALVDYQSGMLLGSSGGGVNLELAAAGNTDVVRAKMRTMDSLGIKGGIDDILITLDNQYHIIYMISGTPLFLYMVLQKDKANLAMARYKIKTLCVDLKI